MNYHYKNKFLKSPNCFNNIQSLKLKNKESDKVNMQKLYNYCSVYNNNNLFYNYDNHNSNNFINKIRRNNINNDNNIRPNNFLRNKSLNRPNSSHNSNFSKNNNFNNYNFKNNSQHKNNTKYRLKQNNKNNNNAFPNINNNYGISSNNFFENKNYSNNFVNPSQRRTRCHSAIHSSNNNRNYNILSFSDNFSSNNKPYANGLVNIGATCYMNATLQCLAHIQNLTNFLLKFKPSQETFTSTNKYKLTNAYIEVLKNIWENPNINNYSPNNFKRVISEMNPLFEGINANDSKDLIIFLMETLHNELNKAKKISLSNFNSINQTDYQSTFNLFSKYYTNNYKSVISDIFYGMYNSLMRCCNCNITVNNIQCFNILIFPLNEVKLFKQRYENIVNINECFEYYQKYDIMKGENQIYCNYCNKYSNSINWTKLIISPRILVINLNRGTGLQYDIKLYFEQYLNISNFVYYNNQCPTFYELIGIVTHFGRSSMSGHFIAFCKSFKDLKWYKYNDAQVVSSSFEEAKNTGVPYILFYSSIKT